MLTYHPSLLSFAWRVIINMMYTVILLTVIEIVGIYQSRGLVKLLSSLRSSSKGWASGRLSIGHPSLIRPVSVMPENRVISLSSPSCLVIQSLSLPPIISPVSFLFSLLSCQLARPALTCWPLKTPSLVLLVVGWGVRCPLPMCFPISPTSGYRAYRFVTYSLSIPPMVMIPTSIVFLRGPEPDIGGSPWIWAQTPCVWLIGSSQYV